MVKRKTSVSLEEDTWKAFTIFAIQRTGSNRRVSEEVEQALKNYMTDYRDPGGRECKSFMCVIGVANPLTHRILRKKAKEGYNTLFMRMWKK